MMFFPDVTMISPQLADHCHRKINDIYPPVNQHFDSEALKFLGMCDDVWSFVKNALPYSNMAGRKSSINTQV